MEEHAWLTDQYEQRQKMNRYSYHGFQKIIILILQILGILGIIFSACAAIIPFVGSWIVSLPNNSISILNDPRLTLICNTIFILLVGCSISFGFINYLPTIWTDENGIQISVNIFFRTQIPWASIVDIGSGSPPKGHLLVRARKISLFHWIFGLLYVSPRYPGFLIGPGIENREKLIDEIRLRIN